MNMRFPATLLVALGAAIWASLAQAQEVPPKGNLVLPVKAVVFGPFERSDAPPSPELLRRLPAALELGGRRAAGRAAAFDPRTRALDLAPFTGAEVGNAAWVYLAFATEATGSVTFGFGADWWYEAYLDGRLVSETLSRGDRGNEAWPPSIRDFTATVEVAKGDHVLAVRVIRGKASALLAVGGPTDLRNPAIAGAAVKTTLTVTKAGYREGPPAGKMWRMVWNDEFNGTAIDTAKWHLQSEAGWSWPGLKTAQSDANLSLDGQGSLVARLTQDPDGTVRYHRGMNTRSEKAYGYFETRVQFSRQPGWWTAVWLAGYPYDDGPDAFVNSQEFDIFEDFYKPKTHLPHIDDWCFV